MSRIWGALLVVLISSGLVQADNFEHENMETSKTFQKEFGILDRMIRNSEASFGVEEYLRQQRINRVRDRGQDFLLTKTLETNYLAVANKDLVESLLLTMRESHNRSLLETTKLVTNETIKRPDSKAKPYLDMYNEVVNSRYYHFRPEEKKNARLYIDGSPTINAYSFTGHPQTLYYLGLIDALSPEGLRSVMGHELGHAVSRHVDHRIELYAYLLLGGYYFFNDSAEMKPGFKLQNPILESFKENIPMMTMLDPKLVQNSNLNAFEKSAVKMFSAHAGDPASENYSEKMGSYLRTVAELANKIFIRAEINGQFEELERLILALESVIIDDSRLEKRVNATLARGRSQNGQVKTRLAKLFTNVNMFYEQIQYGLMALSRSHERTADHYGLLLAGKEEAMRVEASFMSGHLADIQEELAQREFINQEKRKLPEIHNSEVDRWFLSHPTPLRRLENAEKFQKSYQYRMVTNDFYIAFRDYLDLLEFYGGFKEQIEEFKSAQRDVKESFKELHTVYDQIIEYLEGKRKEPPAQARVEVDMSNEADVNNLKEEIKLLKKQARIDESKALANVKSSKESFHENVPQVEKAMERYAELVSAELGRIGKKIPAGEQSARLVTDLAEMMNDWIKYNTNVEIEDLLDKNGFDRLFSRIAKTNPVIKTALEEVFYKLVEAYRDSEEARTRGLSDLAKSHQRSSEMRAKEQAASIKAMLCSKAFRE
jgi:Zn-dependent protease with chaperone function